MSPPDSVPNTRRHLIYFNRIFTYDLMLILLKMYYLENGVGNGHQWPVIC